MEMNTPDGFALMNWETGYGDWIADPVWDTYREVPWLERTAIVLSDTVDHHGNEIPVSPRTLLKKVAPRRADGLPGHGRLGVRVLPPDRYLRAGPRQGLPRSRAVRLLQRGLPPPPGDEGRADPRPAAQPHDRGRHPDRVLQGRGRPRPARGQHPLHRRPRHGRPVGPVQARGEGDRLAERLRADLHGQAGPHLDRLERPPPHVAVGQGGPRAAVPRRQGQARTACRRRCATSWAG